MYQIKLEPTDIFLHFDVSIDARSIFFFLFRSLACILRVHFDVLFLLFLFCYEALQIVRQKFKSQIAHSIVVKGEKHLQKNLTGCWKIFTICMPPVFISRKAISINLSFANDVIIIKKNLLCVFMKIKSLNKKNSPLCP